MASDADNLISLNSYTVTLTVNDGTINADSITGYTYGTAVTLPTDVTRTNYTFEGWYATSDFSGDKVTAIGATDAGNLTFYAKWVGLPYTVTFNANGGSVTTTSKTVNYGSTYGTLPTPTKTDDTFSGWYTAKTGGTQVTAESTVALQDNQTLYAHWGSAAAASSITIHPLDNDLFFVVNGENLSSIDIEPTGTTWENMVGQPCTLEISFFGENIAYQYGLAWYSNEVGEAFAVKAKHSDGYEMPFWITTSDAKNPGYGDVTFLYSTDSIDLSKTYYLVAPAFWFSIQPTGAGRKLGSFYSQDE